MATPTDKQTCHPPWLAELGRLGGLTVGAAEGIGITQSAPEPFWVIGDTGEGDQVPSPGLTRRRVLARPQHKSELCTVADEHLLGQLPVQAAREL